MLTGARGTGQEHVSKQQVSTHAPPNQRAHLQHTGAQLLGAFTPPAFRHTQNTQPCAVPVGLPVAASKPTCSASSSSGRRKKPKLRPPFSITLAPTLLVMMMRVFLKSTVRPLLSVRRPSSRICVCGWRRQQNTTSSSQCPRCCRLCAWQPAGRRGPRAYTEAFQPKAPVRC